MRKTPQALALCPHRIRKYLGDVNPDHGALRESKERDVPDQEPQEIVLVLSGEEHHGNTRKADCRANRTDQQQRLAPNSVNDGHGQHGKNQVGRAHSYGLQVARDLAESRTSKDVIQIIENGIDPGELVEHPDTDRKKNRKKILTRKELFRGLRLLKVHGLGYFLQLLLVVLFAGQLQDAPRLLHSAPFHQPPWTSRNSEQHDEK